jgi:hypothetical protein
MADISASENPIEGNLMLGNVLSERLYLPRTGRGYPIAATLGPFFNSRITPFGEAATIDERSKMTSEHYSAYIGTSVAIAEDVPYAILLRDIVRFTAEAAAARCADDARWEQEELRKKGLSALELYRDGKAVWEERRNFDSELAEARVTGCGADFVAANQLDAALLAHLDRDLRKLWRQAGYDAHALIHNMKRLFSELEADIGASSARARRAFVDEIAKAVRT